MDDNSVLQAAEDILGVESTSPSGTETNFRGGSEFYPNKRTTVHKCMFERGMSVRTDIK